MTDKELIMFITKLLAGDLTDGDCVTDEEIDIIQEQFNNRGWTDEFDNFFGC